jgi:hypothetical protein
MSTDGYVLQFVDSWLEALNADTINVKVFWKDHFFTRDHNAINTILATSFPDFEKGDDLKSRSFAHDILALSLLNLHFLPSQDVGSLWHWNT